MLPKVRGGGEAGVFFEYLGEGVNVRVAERNGDFCEPLIIAFKHFLRLADAERVDIGDGREPGDRKEKLAEINGGDAAERGQLVVFYCFFVVL